MVGEFRRPVASGLVSRSLKTMASFNGTITKIEIINRRYSGQCHLCDFVTTKTFRADAEDDLAAHLRDFHRVPPTIVQAAPFAPVAKASGKSEESK